jgi:predicted O-methyltransferase YrrM
MRPADVELARQGAQGLIGELRDVFVILHRMFRVRQSLVQARGKMYAGPPFARRLATLTTYRGYARQRPMAALQYLLVDRGEVDNFTYEIDNGNEIPEFLAAALGMAAPYVAKYVDEIDGDSDLRIDLEGRLARRRDRNRVARYGRRVAWYALARSLRPRLIIESGVHDGIGSSLLLRALQRNRADGFEGRLLGIDINPSAGWLIPPFLRSVFEMRVEHSLKALASLTEQEVPDLFIHDSDHRYEYEMAEYRAVMPHLHDRTVLLSDSDNREGPLKVIAAETFRAYSFWKERSVRHFYPGDGIGLAVPQRGHGSS